METQTMDQLNRNDRLRLVKFVCSFAWADLEIHPEERTFVDHIVRLLELNDEDQSKVEGWMAIPPSPESVDPTRIPMAQRKLFLDSIEGVIISDGRIAPEERENLALLKEPARLAAAVKRLAVARCAMISTTGEPPEQLGHQAAAGRLTELEHFLEAPRPAHVGVRHRGLRRVRIEVAQQRDLRAIFRVFRERHEIRAVALVHCEHIIEPREVLAPKQPRPSFE